jgi:transcriptional regulator with XRE-family HTH domain
LDKTAFTALLRVEVDAWLARTGRKQEELARAAGMSPSTLTDALRGAMPGADKLSGLAREMGVSADYLLGLSDERVRPPATSAQRVVQIVRQAVELVEVDPAQLDAMWAALQAMLAATEDEDAEPEAED